MAERCRTFSAGSVTRAPCWVSQRKNDLVEVMRRASVLGLQGIARSFSIHSKKRLSSLVVMEESVASGGKNSIKSFTSERKALTVLGERPWSLRNISQAFRAGASVV